MIKAGPPCESKRGSTALVNWTGNRALTLMRASMSSGVLLANSSITSPVDFDPVPTLLINTVT